MPAGGCGPAEARPANPVSAHEIESILAGLIPLPPPPVLAVAVSGGADSLALVRLADAWARPRGGRVIGLTVDHGLRPGAAAEVAQVARWLGQVGIAHRALAWRGPKPRTGIQAAAREARYGLLCGWCRDQGVGTLMVGHHRDDQAETFLMRLARGSRADGLAAMAPDIQRNGVRIVRPLLAIPKIRLEATCAALGQKWIEDPSNSDPRFGRTHARARLAGLDAAAIAAAAAAFGRARSAREGAVRELLATAATEFAAGYILLNRRALASAPEEVGLRALSRVLCRVSGAVHGPGTAALTALHRAVARGLDRTRSLHRCLTIPHAGSRLLVCREPRNLPSAPLRPGTGLLWDRRFRVTLDDRAAVQDTRVAALGAAGWRQIRTGADARLGARLRHSIPVLWQHGRVVSAPSLGVQEPNAGFAVRFSPALALLPTPFAVVSPAETPIFRKEN